MNCPVIIQGGMGAGVSNWQLAKTVSRMGHLGVVSGTALDLIFTRRLQTGDLDGHMRRALKNFPFKNMFQKVLDEYFIFGGKRQEDPFKPVPMCSINPSQEHLELIVIANFVEVFLAKEGHDGIVGINYLEKIQLPHLPSLYGAMLAGVDYVLMGAGIPREIPGILDKLARKEEVSLTLNVENATKEDTFKAFFNPKKCIRDESLPNLKRPQFLPVIASSVLAHTLAKKSSGKVNGFVVEGYVAGGHNALPRGLLRLNEKGEPIYGEKDQVDLESIKALGLPVWLAGSFGTPEKLREALNLGVNGIQVGTPFAFCKESGLTEEIKQKVLYKALKGEAHVFTDPHASPTGFPFKVVNLEGSNSEIDVYKARKKVCDLGYLRHMYKDKDGTVEYRCPAEPEDIYVRKGGTAVATKGRKCLCNCLMANIGFPQIRKDGYVEKPLVTAGEDLDNISRFLDDDFRPYSAEDVIRYLLGEKSTDTAPHVCGMLAASLSHT